MFGMNGGEFLIILVIALVLIGPERLPEYAQQFREWVVRGRDYVRKGQATVSSEFGDQVDWSKLDPRQYDPRVIVRDAFADTPPAASRVTTRATGAAAASASATAVPGARAPFDDDAT